MIKRIILLSGFLVVAFFANGQYVSRLGKFSVDQKKGCAPFTIIITDTNLLTSGECTPGKPCNMDFEGKGQQQNLFTYTYTTPGTFKLSVLYQSSPPGTGPDDIMITVDPNIKPDFEVYTCSSNRVSLKVTNKDYDQYVINFGDGSPTVQIPVSNNATATHNYAGSGAFTISVKGQNLNSAPNCTPMTNNFNAIATLPAPKITTLTSLDNTSLKLDFATAPNIQYRLEIALNNSSTFQLFQTLYGVLTLTIPNLKLDDNYYCFRLGAFDPCTGNSTYSPTICSHKFSLNIQSGVNQLNWISGTAGVSSIEVQRDAKPYTTIPGAPLFFDDKDVTCKINYCYIVSNNYSNGSKSISLEKCGTSFANASPTRIENTSAVVNETGQSVDLIWIQDPKFKAMEYTLLRRSNAGAFSVLTLVKDSKYTDPTYTTSGNFCYRIDYADECDNASAPGEIVCPLRLTGTIDSKNVISLAWNSYKGWKNGVKNYTVEKYNKTGLLIKSFTTSDTTFVDDQSDPNNQVVSYKIAAISQTAGLTASISNVLSFIKEANLFYATAFTPNGDKLNDSFTVSGQFIVKINLKIFDRWGVLIFSTEKNEPWDGNSGGKLMPEGAYIWKVDITDLADRTFSESGTIFLMQKGK